MQGNTGNTMSMTCGRKLFTSTRMVARKPGVNRCDWSHRGDNTKYRNKK